MKVGFIDIVLIVLFFQLLSLTPYLFIEKRSGTIANKLLACFLLAKALCISNFLSFRLWDFTFAHFPHTFLFGSSFTLLWGPLLYFYTRALTRKNFRFRSSDCFHFLPFLGHFLFLTFRFHLHSADTKRALLTSGNFLPRGFFYSTDLYFNSSGLIYIIFSILILINYRKELKNNYSSTGFVNLSWMYLVLIGFSLKWALDLWYVAGVYLDGSHHATPLFLSRSALFLFVNLMNFKGMNQPVVFVERAEKTDKRRPSLSKAIAGKYLSHLQNIMDKERPWSEPELTLGDLSKMTGIPVRSLTEILNEHLKKNFFDYINTFRINESMRLIWEQDPRFKTILEVMYEVGFNNKTSFNSAFRKAAGMTPTRYRELAVNRSGNMAAFS